MRAQRPGSSSAVANLQLARQLRPNAPNPGKVVGRLQNELRSQLLTFSNDATGAALLGEQGLSKVQAMADETLTDLAQWAGVKGSPAEAEARIEVSRIIGATRGLVEQLGTLRTRADNCRDAYQEGGLAPETQAGMLARKAHRGALEELMDARKGVVDQLQAMGIGIFGVFSRFEVALAQDVVRSACEARTEELADAFEIAGMYEPMTEKPQVRRPSVKPAELNTVDDLLSDIFKER